MFFHKIHNWRLYSLMKGYDMSFYIHSWSVCFSTKFKTKGFIPKWMDMMSFYNDSWYECFSTKFATKKALFLNARLWYVFLNDSWCECFSTKFTTKGFIPKWTANISLFKLIVDMNVFPQNSQLKALFLNEQLIYVFLHWLLMWMFLHKIHN